MALEVVTVGEFLLESMATSWGMGRVGVTGSVGLDMTTRLFSEPTYKLANTISTEKFYWITQTIDIFFDDVHF